MASFLVVVVVSVLLLSSSSSSYRWRRGLCPTSAMQLSSELASRLMAVSVVVGVIDNLSSVSCLVADSIFFVVSVVSVSLSSSRSFSNADGIVVGVGFPSHVCLRCHRCCQRLIIFIGDGVPSSPLASCWRCRKRQWRRVVGVGVLTFTYLYYKLPEIEPA